MRFSLVVVVAFTACFEQTLEHRPCGPSGECLPSYVCEEGFCVLGAAGGDAGQADGGSDAGARDAGPRDAGPGDAGTGDSGADAGTTVVTGVRMTHYVLSGGTGVADVPLTDELHVFVLDGGDFVPVALTVDDAGFFSFDSPQRPYYIGSADRWLVTSAAAIDLSVNVQGRPGQTLVPADAGGVMFTVTVDGGLVPWVDGDYLWLITESAPELGELDPLAPIPAGATSFSNQTFGYQSYMSDTALSADAGDSAIFAQTRGTTRATDAGSDDGGAVYLRTVSLLSAGPAPVSIVGGVTTPLNLEMTPLTLNSVPITWGGSEWAALTGQVHPTAFGSHAGVSIYAVSPDLTRGFFGNLTSLIDVSFVGHPGTISQPNGKFTVSYGTPNPNWAQVATVLCAYREPAQLINTQPAGVLALAGTTDQTYIVFGTTPIRPKMSPPRNLTIEGDSAQSDPKTLKSRTPLVTWDVPTLGRPTAYRVDLMEIYSAGGYSLGRRLDFLFTTDTQVRVPPGWMQSQVPYVIGVMAMDGADAQFNPDRAPFYDPLVNHFATALTSLVTAPP